MLKEKRKKNRNAIRIIRTAMANIGSVQTACGGYAKQVSSVSSVIFITGDTAEKRATEKKKTLCHFAQGRKRFFFSEQFISSIILAAAAAAAVVIVYLLHTTTTV